MLAFGMGGAREVHVALIFVYNCLASTILFSIIAELATNCAHGIL